MYLLMTLRGNKYDMALERFLSSAPRYRLAVLGVNSPSGDDHRVLNMGRELAKTIPAFDRHNELAFQFSVQEAVNRIVREHTISEPNLGDVVLVENLGILFEPELHIDVPELLRRVSRNTLVVLLWQGEITKDKLYFLRSSSSYCISQSEINYILL